MSIVEDLKQERAAAWSRLMATEPNTPERRHAVRRWQIIKRAHVEAKRAAKASA